MIIKGSLLKTLRTEAELTQSKLADLVGVSQAHIAKIEGEKVDPRLSTVNRILEVLMEGRETRCGEIMTQGVITAGSGDSIQDVCAKMMENAISQMPIKDGKRVVGTITEKNIVQHMSSDISKERVEKIMEPQLPSVSEDTGIDTIRSLLENHPGVLITRNGEIVGIITRSDLLKVISKIL
jgi:predicted transcriptional regulator